MSPRAKGSVTDEHKAAMAQGRNEARAIAVYLEALEQHKPKRGRKRTAESVDRQLADIDAQMPSATGINKLRLVQQRLDLLQEREMLGTTVDLSALEDAFARAAKSYSQRKGVSYAAWREIGVPGDMLKRAGIGRGNGDLT